MASEREKTSMTKKIVLTGGGTAGHVTPNIALIPHLHSYHWEIHYLGMKSGFERELLENIQDITFHPIDSGKLRRYVDWKNISDIYHILKGYFDSRTLLKSIQPDIVFSKGGYVSVPVVLAAHYLHIPVVIHESDLTPGLANKISARYASMICTSFPETVSLFSSNKAVYTGSPVRDFIKSGDPEKGRKLARFTSDKPVIVVLGGSQGSVFLNQLILDSFPALTRNYQILLVCGSTNKIDMPLQGNNYWIVTYLKEEIADCLAMADLVISRAGANTLFELLALKKPSLLIPLSFQASRGDQVDNGRNFEKHGFSIVLDQQQVTPEKLIQTIQMALCNLSLMTEEMANWETPDTIGLITSILEKLAKSR
jgi:UDP-N-acetylglucosamine--N-acetylmuramyl-(pentapeptide) pyrophosphoryl-undecaprenol N-acetylglucosamine transferase